MAIVKTIRCLVPGCDRSWFLEGGSQGFVKAAALKHAWPHWAKHHEAQKHPDVDALNLCKECHPSGFCHVIEEKFHQR
jgi:hypothetical protein